MPSCGGGEGVASRRAMRRPERPLSLRAALALGLLQGPTELLPVSSSAHTTLLAWFAGWPYGELDGELRKSFEVALHAGAGAALAVELRGELARGVQELDAAKSAVLALALAPPVLAGLVFRSAIERRLGGPRSIACGLIAGALAMAFADIRGAGEGARARACGEAQAFDGLALGLAQAGALIPGVSRNGATLAAARGRGFSREAAQALSWNVALPVLLGASVLKAIRLLRHGVPSGARASLALGATAAFLSTLASAGLLRRGRGWRAGRVLLPYSLYRCVLAALVLRRLRRAQ
jgi:undecaprenyl-diphosphatase